MFILTGVNGSVFADEIYCVEPGFIIPVWSGDEPEREGYTFLGWSSSTEVTETVQENITFTALWELIPVEGDLWEPDL